MAENSKIAWTRHTFNPWMGCTRVGPGCDHCYAAVSTPARSLGVKWGVGEPRRRTSERNWHMPIKWNEQAKSTGEFTPVFCASLADVFDNEVPDEWRTDLWDLIAETPHLSWLLVTKRIGNVAKMVPPWWMEGTFPENVRILITVVNQEEADRDIPKLLALPCNNGISYEPALGPVDWGMYLSRTNMPGLRLMPGFRDPLPGIEWVIVGGESDQAGAKARPFDVQWARSTVAQCKAAGVACFVKQIGSFPKGWCAALLHAEPCDRDVDSDYCDFYEASEMHMPCSKGCSVLKDRAGADPTEWPEDLRVQEFPGGKVLA